MFKGDIVLIPLSYQSEAHGNLKLVPALVLGLDNEGSATVAFITTQVELQDECDLILHPKKGNGLKRRSLVRLNKMITIDKEYITGRLGTLSTREMNELNVRLLQLFELGDM
ncbi:MAG: type II toxin-antitoxin system PemK/MazF family toxin [Balneolia bacterium]|nr:type II toxin-antitoxin system PemK/MazF family toxin [Balneolia bacterium]